MVIHHHPWRYPWETLGSRGIYPQPFLDNGLKIRKPLRRRGINLIERSVGAADLLAEFTVGFRISEKVIGDCGEECGDSFSTGDAGALERR